MNSPFSVLAYADARVVGRDPLLKWVVLFPLGLALLLRLLIPKVHAAAFATSGFDITPYYPLVMGGYVMTAPGIVGMVIGFLLLDERDERTLTALRVTPLSIRRYLAYRIAMPLLAATTSTLLGYPLIGITPLSTGVLTAIAVVGGLSTPLFALVFGITAPNKVAGLAVVKILNGVNLLPAFAFFVPTPIQFVAGAIPTYWPMRALWSAAAGESCLAFLAIGTAISLLALAVAGRQFERALLRRG